MRRLEVLPGPEDLSARVAADLLAVLAEAQAAGRDPHVVLTGGAIAAAIHRELGRRGAATAVDWSRVHVWWGDERFVDPASEERNSGAARADFCDVVGIPADRVHEPPSTHEAADVHDAASAYARTLAAEGPEEFEVVLLGVGPDGHVASLFPGFRQLSSEETAVGVTDSPKPPPERVTLTLNTLNRSRRVWFVVACVSKASAVAQAYVESAEPPGPDPALDLRLPAARVRGREVTVWYTDEAAASQLQ